MATTRYPGELWADREFRPALSDHAIQRWDERMPHEARAPEWVLDRAITTDFVCRHPHFRERETPADGVLLYRGETTDGHEYGVIAIVVDGAVVTVYRMRSVFDPPLRRYLRSLAEYHGGIHRE